VRPQLRGEEQEAPATNKAQLKFPEGRVLEASPRTHQAILPGKVRRHNHPVPCSPAHEGSIRAARDGCLAGEARGCLQRGPNSSRCSLRAASPRSPLLHCGLTFAAGRCIYGKKEGEPAACASDSSRDSRRETFRSRWGVVELVRRLTLDQEAAGSNPASPATLSLRWSLSHALCALCDLHGFSPFPRVLCALRGFFSAFCAVSVVPYFRD
jgi:hypothetical protein